MFDGPPPGSRSRVGLSARERMVAAMKNGGGQASTDSAVGENRAATPDKISRRQAGFTTRLL